MKPKSARELGKEIGRSHVWVMRERGRGKTDEQIKEDARRSEATAQEKAGAGSDGVSFAEAQRRKELALAELRELELKLKLGALLDAKEVAAAWHEMISSAKTRLLLIPDELGDRLAGEANPIKCRELIREKIHHALTAMSQQGEG